MTISDRINRIARSVPAWPFYPLLLVPGLWTFWLALNGRLGADPMRELEHDLGIWALRFMIAVLCVTLARRFFNLNLIKFRRLLGLTAFVYALAHLTVWLLLDRQLMWGEIIADLYKRPYIIFGMLAFLLILPLAFTSNNWSVRKLGAAGWNRLHRLAYPAAVLMILHYLWLVKSWTLEPLTYTAIMAAVLLAKLAPRKAARSRQTKTA